VDSRAQRSYQVTSGLDAHTDAHHGDTRWKRAHGMDKTNRISESIRLRETPRTGKAGTASSRRVNARRRKRKDVVSRRRLIGRGGEHRQGSRETAGAGLPGDAERPGNIPPAVQSEDPRRAPTVILSGHHFHNYVIVQVVLRLSSLKPLLRYLGHKAPRRKSNKTANPDA
jgi:hypothetical protein